ncbi:peptidoglycan-binding domain-containing protein [Streptomyces sp. NBC_01465]|uniref:peptidoglycan-binding domain-containing protein n=1 Tax=Streptomyces sp. NBC_01465 TaxID=2903878 RepID=UPI002E30E06F|nr:peptidoglycan-binding domain-containing protein [Streptomyces sp. NBC_01465]
MTLWTALDPALADVDPGGRTTARLRVRNTGDTVEEYRLSVVGTPAGWARIEPGTLRLYPGAEETAEISFAPPRSPDVAAGPAPYGIRVEPAGHPALRDVVEGQITVAPFAEIRAELLPPTLVGRVRGQARIAVDNLGNTPLTASLVPRDESAQLTFTVDPVAIEADPGRAAFARLTVRPQRVRWTGQSQSHRLTVAVRRSGDETAHDLAGTFEQRPVFARWVVAVGGAVVAAAVAFGVLWFGFSPKFGTGTGEVRAAGNSAKPEAQGNESGLPKAPTPSPTAATDDGGGSTGGGSGTGGSGSGATKAAKSGGGTNSGSGDTQAATPPWRKGYASDLVVEYAQRRLAGLSSSNKCRLTGSWNPGVIDARTETSLLCYQNAVQDDGHSTGHNTAQIFATDDQGALGRATLTSLWAQSVNWKDVQPGKTNFEVTQVQAALWWALQSQVSTADLGHDRQYAQYGVDYWKSGTKSGHASTYDDGLKSAVKQYQSAVGLPATGVVDAKTVQAMVGGSVKDPGVTGS